MNMLLLKRRFSVSKNINSRLPQLVSDAGVQVEVRREHLAAPPAPVVPAPRPQPQDIRVEEMLHVQTHNQTLNKQQDKEVVYQPQPPPRERPALEIQRRAQNPELVADLTNTLGKSGGEILRPPIQRANKVSINEKSSPEDVTRWLQEKGMSLRVIELLDGQDGANMFSLSKLHLQQACGKEEGGYLYSQLLVQKKRSGYRTHTGDELKAILNHRRNHVELSNEAPADEPTFAVNPVH